MTIRLKRLGAQPIRPMSPIPAETASANHNDGSGHWDWGAQLALILFGGAMLAMIAGSVSILSASARHVPTKIRVLNTGLLLLPILLLLCVIYMARALGKFLDPTVNELAWGLRRSIIAT
jgi:hypothetical protein